MPKRRRPSDPEEVARAIALFMARTRMKGGRFLVAAESMRRALGVAPFGDISAEDYAAVFEDNAYGWFDRRSKFPQPGAHTAHTAKRYRNPVSEGWWGLSRKGKRVFS